MMQHFSVIDRTMADIRESEAVLDDLLLSPDEAAQFNTISVVPLPHAPPSMDLSRTTEALADDVASRIKTARKKKGWRQKDLAEATGIARPNIARLESGRRIPKITTLHKICQALGIPVETLLG